MRFKNFITEKLDGLLYGKYIGDHKITKKTAEEVWEGDFSVGNLGLISLVGSPKQVNGGYFCYGNNLTDLQGMSPNVTFNINCSGSKLKSLKGAPERVNGWMDCSDNLLTSFVGGPKTVATEFNASLNLLTSLEGAPTDMGNIRLTHNSHLTNLKDVHKHIKSLNGIFNVEGCPLKSHVLGLLLIDGLTWVFMDNKDVQNILNKYITKIDNSMNMRRQFLLQAQEDMIEAGLEEYAKL